MIVNSNESVHTGFGIVANRTLFSDKPETILFQHSHNLAKFHFSPSPLSLSNRLFHISGCQQSGTWETSLPENRQGRVVTLTQHPLGSTPVQKFKVQWFKVCKTDGPLKVLKRSNRSMVRQAHHGRLDPPLVLSSSKDSLRSRR